MKLNIYNMEAREFAPYVSSTRVTEKFLIIY